ncbi:MAG: hypothetical protein J0M11_05225 [Anaerolineae bacterium]|nr:hypothetical protein [Anaerolineae bacterium]
MNDERSGSENQSYKRLQLTISVVAVVLAVVHMAWPNIKVDSITIVLMVISVLPWLAPLIKSLELPGGYKLEFRDVQNAKEKADKAGLLDSKSKSGEPDSLYMQIAERDPNLALAGLRIEIEKRLLRIAQANDISTYKLSVGKTLRLLAERQAITKDEYYALQDIVSVLNPAVHGATVSRDTVEYALDMGTSLLNALDEKIPSEDEKVKSQGR